MRRIQRSCHPLHNPVTGCPHHGDIAGTPRLRSDPFYNVITILSCYCTVKREFSLVETAASFCGLHTYITVRAVKGRLSALKKAFLCKGRIGKDNRPWSVF